MLRFFLLRIATCLLKTADWGTKTRVVIGALLSFLDMATDINMVLQFFKGGQGLAARAIIITVSLNLLLQLVIVYAQNRRKPGFVIVREMMIVLSCMKPGVDAYRVLQGGEKDPLLALDPLLEMVFSKATELALEALPGSVLQTLIFLNSPTKTDPLRSASRRQRCPRRTQ